MSGAACALTSLHLSSEVSRKPEPETGISWPAVVPSPPADVTTGTGMHAPKLSEACRRLTKSGHVGVPVAEYSQRNLLPAACTESTECASVRTWRKRSGSGPEKPL